MNYEAERAMNQKRLRMDGEPGHGVVQGNGIPLNYMDNGHQIPYQPYAGAYNTHYPPPDAFAAYGPPPPGGYAPQNLSYAPPAHQNYAHHQSFPPQQPQAQLHMAQTHMLQGYPDVGMHKAAWPPQPHLLPPLDPHKPLDVKQPKPEIKVEPTDPQKRPHPEGDRMGGDMDQPKIKIKTDIFKPDDLPHRVDVEKAHDVAQTPMDAASKPDPQHKEDGQPIPGVDKVADKPAEACKTETGDAQRAPDSTTTENKASEVKRELGSPDRPAGSTTPGKITSPEGKKRGRPRGSTNKPKPPAPPNRPAAPRAPAAGPAHAPQPRARAPGYQYAIRPFRKDFSGIQFRRRWSDDCLSSAHIPNEVYFGDVPVSTEVLFNYYDANAEREKLAAQAAHIAAQKAAAAKLAAAKLQARGILTAEASSSDDASAQRKKLETQAAQIAAQMANLRSRGILRLTAEASSSRSNDASAETNNNLKTQSAARKAASNLALAKLQARGVLTMSTEVTTVDSSSSDDSSGSSGSDDSDTDDDRPLKKTPGRPKGSKSSPRTKPEGGGRRGRPPVPPELREPGITDMKRFCKLAGVRFDYKKLVEGCTKNKERVSKMMELLYAAGLEGKPTADKCAALKQAKIQKKNEEKRAKQVTKVDVKREEGADESGGDASTRRVTRGQTGVKPRQKIVISSDEEDDTPSARRTLSKLRSMCEDDEDSN